MGLKKFAITDEKKLRKLIKKVFDEQEFKKLIPKEKNRDNIKNCVVVLTFTGIHPIVYTDPKNWAVQWDGQVLSYKRAKTKRNVVVRIPTPLHYTFGIRDKQIHSEIDKWLSDSYDLLTRQRYDQLLKEYGKKINVPAKNISLSANNLRSTYIYWDLYHHLNPALTEQRTGCSEKVIRENYSLLPESVLKRGRV